MQLTMNGIDYAAKSYFHMDAGHPFETDQNAEQLKMELTRQAIAKSILAEFNKLVCESGNISTAGM